MTPPTFPAVGKLEEKVRRKLEEKGHFLEVAYTHFIFHWPRCGDIANPSYKGLQGDGEM